MNKFFVTTPIYYVNDVPHVGHAYTTVAADVVARYWKQKLGGNNVFFLTGTDEHGAKVAQSAKENDARPKEYADSVAPRFQEAWKLLNIEPDYFIRTTDPRHEKIVQDLLQKIYDKGYIYEGVYEGLYCVGCERFLAESDLVDGKCPLHPTKQPVHQKEKNYFFKLSSFKQTLQELFESDRVKILPGERKNEILGKLKSDLQDISISRAGVSWGIPVPWDNSQTVYVWVDALFNYYTATQFLESKEKFWPADLHIIGKDILWFHTVTWYALLLALEVPLPKIVFAHGFFTINGQKMSKSLGNVIAPKELVHRFGADATRYLLLSQFPFGQDGDFSFEKLAARYNADLANNLGNLVARVAKLCENANLEVGPFQDDHFQPVVEESIQIFHFDGALSYIWNNIQELNKEIDQNKLWENTDTDEKVVVLVSIVEGIRNIAYNLQPFLPETAEKILKQFAGPKIASGQPLFPRIA